MSYSFQKVGEKCTYETEAEHPQGTNGVKQHSDTKHLDVDGTDDQVIDKVASSAGGDQSTDSCVAVDPFGGVHGGSLFVHPHSP